MSGKYCNLIAIEAYTGLVSPMWYWRRNVCPKVSRNALGDVANAIEMQKVPLRVGPGVGQLYKFSMNTPGSQQKIITILSYSSSESVSVSVSLSDSTSPSVSLPSLESSTCCRRFLGGAPPVLRDCIWPAMESVSKLVIISQEC